MNRTPFLPKLPWLARSNAIGRLGPPATRRDSTSWVKGAVDVTAQALYGLHSVSLSSDGQAIGDILYPMTAAEGRPSGDRMPTKTGDKPDWTP